MSEQLTQGLGGKDIREHLGFFKGIQEHLFFCLFGWFFKCHSSFTHPPLLDQERSSTRLDKALPSTAAQPGKKWLIIRLGSIHLTEVLVSLSKFLTRKITCSSSTTAHSIPPLCWARLTHFTVTHDWAMIWKNVVCNGNRDLSAHVGWCQGGF